MPKKKPVRYESSIKLLGWPLVSVATGPDLDKGEIRGWARGIIAVGDVATGVIAIGGASAGVVSIGGVSAGVFALGGAALGGLVMAGAAIGFAAFGGAAVGYYAKGGAAIGKYIVSPQRQDPEAVKFFGPLGEAKAKREEAKP